MWKKTKLGSNWTSWEKYSKQERNPQGRNGDKILDSPKPKRDIIERKIRGNKDKYRSWI